MAARPIILFRIAAAAAGRRSVTAVALLALTASFLVLFLLFLKLFFKGFHLLNGVILPFVASDAPMLAAVSAVLT